MQYAEAQLASGDGATNAGDARSRSAVAAELARTAEDETCARVARWHLRRQGYPHVDELETCEARGGTAGPSCSRSRGRYAPVAKPIVSPTAPPAPPPDLPIPPHTQPRLDIDRRRCNATTSSRGRTPTPTPRPSSTRHRAVTHRSRRVLPRSPQFGVRRRCIHGGCRGHRAARRGRTKRVARVRRRGGCRDRGGRVRRRVRRGAKRGGGARRRPGHRERRRWRRRRGEDSRVALGKQTSALAARLQQMFSRVRELERARAIGRHDLHAAPTQERDADGEGVAAERRDHRRLRGLEVRLVRDDDARAHARAMRRTLAANVAANDAIGLSDTFWAWMESVLALEEREELEGDAVGRGRRGRYSRARGSGADPGAPSLARALRDVQANVKTVADACASAGGTSSARRRRGTPRRRGSPRKPGRRRGWPRRSAGDRVPREVGSASATAGARARTPSSARRPGRARSSARARRGGVQASRPAQIETPSRRRMREGDTAAAADGSDERGVWAGGTRVASEEFPPGVAERLVARGASFDGAFFDGAK